MSTSNIEWTDDTPNPIVGCTKQSAGCENCYAIRMAWRLMHSDKPAVAQKYEGTVQKTKNGKLNWTGRINIDHQAMARVLKQKKPKMYFVNSMGDLFHPSVSFKDIDIVFAAMAIAHWHTFQILTKHPDSMVEWLNYKDKKGRGTAQRIKNKAALYWNHSNEITSLHSIFAPVLKNVWMGTSVENQKEANNRIAHLQEVSKLGWTTWVSNEPALGSVDWAGWEFINWMVTGGESGPDARPMHPKWAQQSRDFCTANNIPFFFKQWGAWAPVDAVDPTHDIIYQPGSKMGGLKYEHLCINEAGQSSANANDLSWQPGEENCIVYKFGKHISGRQLDGRTHDEYPATV